MYTVTAHGYNPKGGETFVHHSIVAVLKDYLFTSKLGYRCTIGWE